MKYEGIKISKGSVDKFFPKKEIDILGYESPIQTYIGQMRIEEKDGIVRAVQERIASVDEEELIKALCYDRDQYDKGYLNGYHAGLNANKWISVKDRLPDPKEYDWVLGAVMATEERWYLPPHVVECRRGEWWAMGDEFSLKDLGYEVTHWMPLPEQPKDDAE